MKTSIKAKSQSKIRGILSSKQAAHVAKAKKAEKFGNKYIDAESLSEKLDFTEALLSHESKAGYEFCDKTILDACYTKAVKQAETPNLTVQQKNRLHRNTVILSRAGGQMIELEGFAIQPNIRVFGKETFLDTNITTVDKTVNNFSSESKRLYSAINQNTDIHNEITQHINKSNEILNEMINEVNRENKMVADLQTTQSNKADLSGTVIGEGGTANIKLSNTAMINIQMKCFNQAMSSLDSDVYNKAIIADMVGLSNASDATSTGKQTAEAVTKVAQEAASNTKVTFIARPERFANINYSDIDITENNISYSDEEITNIVNESITERQILNYCENVVESKKNIQKNIQNLATNMNALVKVDQGNELLARDMMIMGTLNYEMLNDDVKNIVQEYTEYIEFMGKLAGINETENTTDAKGGNEASAKQEAGQDASAKHELDQKAKEETSVSNNNTIITIVVAIVIGIVAVVVIKFLFPKKQPEPEEEPEEEEPEQQPAEEPEQQPEAKSESVPEYKPVEF